MQVLYDHKNQRIPIKAWVADAADVESGALEQALHLSNLPFAFKQVCLMPDVHQGYGMPVGAVLATKDYVVPNAVGVDIGCGMIAQQTTLEADRLRRPKRLQTLLDQILAVVPTGNGPVGNRRDSAHTAGLVQDAELRLCYDKQFTSLHAAYDVPVLQKAFERSAMQLGTLGGGNHFIELQADQEDRVWVMLHSGSRALGKAVCDHYSALARELNERYHSVVPRQWDLAYLHMRSEEGAAYLKWMHLCMRYAEENRRLMLEAVLDVLRDEFPVLETTERIESHHNYAWLENHFGANVLVHRKGAVQAREKAPVIIPGSMETGSYIGLGRGHVESFRSCSHGAGRKLSRNAAKAVRQADDVLAALDRKGIGLGKRNTKDVSEEAGHAYKDVHEVMGNQADLVEVLYRLTPIGVVKG